MNAKTEPASAAWLEPALSTDTRLTISTAARVTSCGRSVQQVVVFVFDDPDGPLQLAVPGKSEAVNLEKRVSYP
jgi:hypothetical protein